MCRLSGKKETGNRLRRTDRIGCETGRQIPFGDPGGAAVVTIVGGFVLLLPLPRIQRSIGIDLMRGEGRGEGEELTFSRAPHPRPLSPGESLSSRALLRGRGEYVTRSARIPPPIEAHARDLWAIVGPSTFASTFATVYLVAIERDPAMRQAPNRRGTEVLRSAFAAVIPAAFRQKRRSVRFVQTAIETRKAAIECCTSNRHGDGLEDGVNFLR